MFLLNIKVSQIQDYKRLCISFHNKFEWDIFIASLGQNKNSAQRRLQGHIPKLNKDTLSAEYVRSTRPILLHGSAHLILKMTFELSTITDPRVDSRDHPFNSSAV